MKVHVHKSYMVKPWTLKKNLMIAAQWLSAPPVAHFPKEISARAIRWLQPCRTQGHRADSPPAHAPSTAVAAWPRASFITACSHPELIRMISQWPIITMRRNRLSKNLKASAGSKKGAPPPQPPPFGARHACARVEFALKKKKNLRAVRKGEGMGWLSKIRCSVSVSVISS